MNIQLFIFPHSKWYKGSKTVNEATQAISQAFISYEALHTRLNKSKNILVIWNSSR